jgi:hypothetical protein
MLKRKFIASSFSIREVAWGINQTNRRPLPNLTLDRRVMHRAGTGTKRGPVNPQRQVEAKALSF